METIEERARNCEEMVINILIWHKGNNSVYGYILDALTEQDSITRNEERERCIRIAQDAHCGMCSIYEVCHNLDGGNFGGECHAKENIRKAMEGGEE